MVNNVSRTWLLGGWITVLALVVTASVAMAASLSTTLLLVALGVAPGIVVAVLKGSGISPDGCRDSPRGGRDGWSIVKLFRHVGVPHCCGHVQARGMHAQDGGHYRDFQLGSDLESVATLTGVSRVAGEDRSRPTRHPAGPAVAATVHGS